jgi:hypothetical protein
VTLPVSRVPQAADGADREGTQVDNLAAAVVAFGLAALLALGGAAAGLGGSTGAAGLSRAPGRPAAVVPIIERAEGTYCGLQAPLLSAVLEVERGFDNTGINECSGALAMAQLFPASGEQWKVNGKPDQDATINPGASLQVRRTYPTGYLEATRPLAGIG